MATVATVTTAAAATMSTMATEATVATMATVAIMTTVAAIALIHDSLLGKRVLTYCEILGKYGKLCLQPDKHLPSTHGKLYIFEKKKISSFQCIVSHAYCWDI